MPRVPKKASASRSEAAKDALSAVPVPPEAAKRAEDLRQEILRHERLYYSENRPEITDAEFDLLMRERLVTEFAELARGFRAVHATSPAWKTVQRAGQQIDPGNALYDDHGEGTAQPREVLNAR